MHLDTPPPLPPTARTLLAAIAAEDHGQGVLVGADARADLERLASAYLVQATPLPGEPVLHVLLLPAALRLLAVDS